MKTFHHKGFTLIEFVTVIVMMGILFAIGARLISQGYMSYINSSNILKANAQSRLALERMGRDIRAIRSPSDISVANASQLTFVDSSGATVAYSLSGSSLIRQGQTLADGVSALTFSYRDASGATTAVLANIRYVTASITVTLGNTNLVNTTSFNPRNQP